jgi:hypothetical protein
MAARLDISFKLWNANVRGRAALSRFTAAKLVEQFPGLSLDWLYTGDRRALSQYMDERFREADALLAAEGGNPA